MADLIPGANAPVPAGDLDVVVEWSPHSSFGEVDVAAFLLGPGGRVSGDADMVFYGQPGTGPVRFERAGKGLVFGLDASVFRISPGQIPAGVERIAFTATLHEAEAKGVDLGSVGALRISVRYGGGEAVSFPLPRPSNRETALILGELYRRDGAWKFRAVAQGYAGGLEPLARGFGVDVEAAPPPPAPAVVDLRKRTVDLTKRDAGLGAAAMVALKAMEAAKVAGVRARFCLALDISGSMRGLFHSGKIDALIQRALGIGFQLDDDGEIDVFVYGARAHVHGPLRESNYKGFAARCEAKHGFEEDTLYGHAIEKIRDYYRSTDNGLPVFVMFVTDGGTRDVRRSKDAITAAAKEPLFWQFMAIGRIERAPGAPAVKIGRSLPRGFDFLAMLDTMEGRVVDNANFFAVEDPVAPSAEEFYAMMMAEFPQWLAKARELRIVKDSR